MDTIEVQGRQFKALNVSTGKANLLMIQGDKGFLGCGYFDVATADKLGEAVAIVTGVKNYQDMLEAKVVRLSQAAKELGLQEGMSGEEALLKLDLLPM